MSKNVKSYLCDIHISNWYAEDHRSFDSMALMTMGLLHNLWHDKVVLTSFVVCCMTDIHIRLSQLTKRAMPKIAKFGIILTKVVILITIINGPTAQAINARQTRYEVVSAGDFQSILAWNCRANTVAKTGPYECLKECVDWDGTRCYAYAYDNDTCWICNEGYQYTMSPSYVATMAHKFWMSDSEYIQHCNLCYMEFNWSALQPNSLVPGRRGNHFDSAMF